MSTEKITFSIPKTRAYGDVWNDLPYPTMDVTADHSIADRLTKIKYDYQYKFRESPQAFLLSPHEYLAFWAACQQSFNSRRVPHSIRDSILFLGIPVHPYADGVVINLDHLTQYVWEYHKKEKQDEKENS